MRLRNKRGVEDSFKPLTKIDRELVEEFLLEYRGVVVANKTRYLEVVLNS